jgi:hypothetical protein
MTVGSMMDDSLCLKAGGGVGLEYHWSASEASEGGPPVD